VHGVGVINRVLLLLALAATCTSASAAVVSEGKTRQVTVPILAYHRFGSTVADSMTVTDDTFAWQLRYLKDQGYTVIRLHALIDFLRGKGAPPPPRAVVLTADDGHRSVYFDMLPLVRQYQVPVTLFIYPSAISNASYAMTWPELAELIRTGLFDVQCHTYWHPNFNHERARLTPPQFDVFVHTQLTKSRQVLETRLGVHVDLLAWPFGIYDDDLMTRAAASGYVAAFTIERRPVSTSDRVMALPRFLMTNADRGSAFARILEERAHVVVSTASAASR
jgi:peptidoglycan/xylan/chitin deacetylase (PgdA/CDA1 family)